jgi:hypothetical protein
MDEFTADEVAPALHLSRNAAAARLDMATALTTRLPATLAALERGEIDMIKARVVVEATDPLTGEQAVAVQERVLGRAGGQTASQLRASLRRAVLRVDPDGAVRRHQERRKERQVMLVPLPDATAELVAHLPAEHAVAIYQRLDALARDARVPGDDRSADARRADTFVDLLLGTHSDMRVEVAVTVPADTLLGISDRPGDLTGYGPISAEMARQLAADAHATWKRLLTDPVDGSLLDYGHTTYRPPAALRDYVQARDRTCRFPGCQQPARRCDLDHTAAYPEGPTSEYNLGTLCRRHHRLKHETRWTVEQHAGSFTWTSPTGRKYTRVPEPLAHPDARHLIVVRLIRSRVQERIAQSRRLFPRCQSVPISPKPASRSAVTWVERCRDSEP